MRARHAAAAALGLGGLALGLGLLSREVGPFAVPGATAHLADATPTLLDTITVRGRRIEVSLDGIVTQVGPDDDVWLAVAGDAFPLRFEDASSIEVEDHLLAVGRLRARGGRRWVDVTDWARIEADVRPPSEVGL